MRVNLFGAWVDALTMDQVEEKIREFVQRKRPHQVVTLNPEILCLARREPELLKLINRAHLVTADGIGIVGASRIMGVPLPERVTGIDLMLRLVDRAAREGWQIFLLGSRPQVAEEAARRLQQQYPALKIAGTYHGYFKMNCQPLAGQGFTDTPPSLDEAEIVEMINEAKPELLFVGMGAPRQEQFIDRNLKLLNVPVAIGVGGSFDVIAGRVARAPVWMQRLHLEWLGRLILEPARWRRMLVLPRFIWLVFWHRFWKLICRK